MKKRIDNEGKEGEKKEGRQGREGWRECVMQYMLYTMIVSILKKRRQMAIGRKQ